MTTITNAADLRDAYLVTYDSFAIVPGDLVDHTDEGRNWNLRYARELLGTLVNAQLVAVSENGEGEDVWQTFPDTYDTMSREEAEQKIDAWLASQTPIEGSSPATTKDKTMTTKAPDKVHPCTCGCGEDVPAKSFYRPGHDARHAGQVARHVAASTENVTDRTLYKDLPSERLVEKAVAIAVKAREKADAKAARAEAKIQQDRAKQGNREEGTIKVGKNEYAATRLHDGSITYFVGNEERTASKTAAKTFTV